MSSPLARAARLTVLVAAMLAASCSRQQDGPVTVSVIGTRQEMTEPLRSVLRPASKLILESTAQGLVAFDASGEILPALAQRWIVEDDGRSYIFRLRRAHWPDGGRITAQEVAMLLKARIQANLALDPLGDLNAVQEVVAMTGEVVEIRLSAARPYFLQILAQPQMTLLGRDGGTGPYRAQKSRDALLLRPIAEPFASGGDREPAEAPAWQNRILRAESAAKAIVRFREGFAALVLGGRLSDLPLVAKANIDNGAVRIDPVQGLYGLAVTGDGAFLDDPAVREAIAMAIEREQLPGAFALGGWAVTNRLVPQQLDLPRPPSDPRWQGLSMEERRSFAENAIRRWAAAQGSPPVLRIALPAGPGSKILFGLIGRDLQRIGVPTRLVGLDDDADLRLVDEVAVYDSTLWYLGRIGCARGVRCSEAAEEKIREADSAATQAERQDKIAQAEALTVANNGYIPLGAPVRWSLVARYLNGFAPSPRARHPLNHLFRATN